MMVVPPPGMLRNKLYIGGDWRAASDGRGISTFDPASGQVLAEVAVASAADIADAVNAYAAVPAGPLAAWRCWTTIARDRIRRLQGRRS